MNQEIGELLQKAYPLENPKECQKRFVRKRLKNTVLAAVAMSIFILILALRPKGEGVIGEDNKISRPEFGLNRLKLLAEYGGRVWPVEFEISARKRSEEEARELFLRAAESLKEHILGENSSLQEVVHDLVLVDALPEYDMQIDWRSGNTDLIRGDGSVQNKELEEAQNVLLKAKLYYDRWEREYTYEVCVYPYPFTKEEAFVRKLYEELEVCGQETAGQQYMKLPDNLGENRIYWKEESQNVMGIAFLLGAVLVFVVYGRESSKLRRKKREREEELLVDYPEFLSRFILLTGAGMTVRSAWERMLSDYKKSGRKRYVYDEMQHTMAQLEVGMSELKAYEEFGRRCAILSYLRFTTILTQNLKKGSSGIVALLRMESEEAFSERKNQARRKGEEAGTKLLFPMGGMLIIVFVLILVPAFASFPV